MKVALVRWFSPHDELSEVIANELISLGHCPLDFGPEDALPRGAEVVFFFAPYGNLYPLLCKARDLLPRPVVVHWNTEGFPDLRLPLHLINGLSAVRSWLGRSVASKCPPFSRINARFSRYRYVGDYHHAWRTDLLDVLADSSAIYADLHRSSGIPVIFAPWGSTAAWQEDLGLKRDIDVLWLGKRGSRRRSFWLDRTRSELAQRGVQVLVVDGEESPFVYGAERNLVLNRSKITLNLTRTWYDDNFSRFAMTAPNRSLIVSEPLLEHCPEWQPGVHYVSSPLEKLAESIIYYLNNEDLRMKMTEEAYRLVMNRITFKRSIQRIMSAAERSIQSI